MRALLFQIAVLTVGAAASQARSQEAPPTAIPPIPAVSEDVLTWDELPETVRNRYEPEIDMPPPQAVLHVMNAVQPDADFRVVDHGDVLIDQRVRPAGLARMTRALPNAKKYGPVGVALSPGVGPEGQYWCWRRAGPLNPAIRINIYCYQDNDGDGTSERLWENTLWQTAHIWTRFQFNSLGQDAEVAETASFAVEPGALGEIEELVILRYAGVVSGQVAPDGSIAYGTIEFELLTGPDFETLSVRQRIRVETDAHGKGEYVGRNGIRMLVDGVFPDGTARIQLLGGLPTGRALLFPALTREFVLDRARQVFNPDGSEKRKGGETGDNEEAVAPRNAVQ